MSVITVLIDDDPIMCLIHKRLLHQPQLALDPLIFHNGQQALDYLFENYKVKNEYMIFLDIHMPVMNGWSFLQELSRQFNGNNLHVFVVSSSIQVSEQKDALRFRQVVEFMEKPLKAENLNRIKTLVNSIRLANQ